MSSPNPQNIIGPSPRQRRVMYADGNTGDIIRVIMYADADSQRFIQTGGLRYLEGQTDRDTLKNIYYFVKGKVNYRGDKPGNEVVRSPAYLFQTAVGDCKSLSVAIAALCRAMGIPYRYRFIKQAGKRNFHHVYVVATPRDESGADVILDAVHRNFNAEPAHAQKIDIAPGQRIPAGIHGTDPAQTFGVWVPIILLFLWFLFSKKLK